jgi:hypothetical protein
MNFEGADRFTFTNGLNNRFFYIISFSSNDIGNANSIHIHANYKIRVVGNSLLVAEARAKHNADIAKNIHEHDF